MIKNSVISSSLAEGKMRYQESIHGLKGFYEIRNEAPKLLKVTTIVPYRPMNGPIIEQIDDD